jgi:hypothetical protein
VPTVTISLQRQGVAPVVNLDTSQTNAGNVRIGTTGSVQTTVKNVGDGNLSGLGDVSNLHGTVTQDRAYSPVPGVVQSTGWQLSSVRPGTYPFPRPVVKLCTLKRAARSRQYARSRASSRRRS